jgi:serine/threonine protein kinase/tetratricopeptide (TPR) repeat protein
MGSERRPVVERLFKAALEREGAERQAFLEGAFALEPDLRAEVEGLLAEPPDFPGHREAPVTEKPAPSFEGTTTTLAPRSASSEDPTSAMEGERVGPYRVLTELGRGGMGTVYLAVRDDDQFKKRVALKLLRKGTESADIIRRFRQERQILASIEHPNVAKLLDGGSTPDGLPYFAMEYVEGKPIDDYSDAHRLTIHDRLKLFRKVCGAVRFAHQNLVIHRDLKPGNILVGSDGEPKLLDFGIAKLLNPELSPITIDVTRIEARVMTPEYASPEQVRGEPITTASDVYSLGVLLYELLTGHRPFRLAGRPLSEIARVICETEPLRPSSVIQQVVEVSGPGGASRQVTPETVSKTREGTPEKLRRKLRGDLENIVLMAMRKERDRRYASAEQLSEDIRRLLEGLPVKARKGTWSYRSSRFIGRHKAALATAALLLVGLLSFTVLTVRERARAEREATKSRAVLDFLQQTLGSANPREGMGREVTVAEALEAAEKNIAQSFAGNPEAEAAVKSSIGFTLFRLGRYDRAEPLLRSALETRTRVHGEEHLDVAESLYHLGVLLRDKSHYAGAEPLLRRSLDLRRKQYGVEHVEVATTLDDLGALLWAKGEYKPAEEAIREALEIRRRLLGDAHPDVASSLNNLAAILMSTERIPQAEPLLREAVDLLKKLRGDNHPELADFVNNLANVVQERSYQEAEPLHREALRLARHTRGDEHPNVALKIGNLARVLALLKQNDEAESLYREALTLQRRLVGDAHPELAVTLSNFATFLTETDRLAEARPLHQEGTDIFLRSVGEGHWMSAFAQSNYGECLRRLRRFEEAEKLLTSAQEVLAAQLGARDRTTLKNVERLVALYADWGKSEKAAEFAALLAGTAKDKQS